MGNKKRSVGRSLERECATCFFRYIARSPINKIIEYDIDSIELQYNDFFKYSGRSGGLNKAAIAGIVIAVLIVIVLAVGGVVYYRKRNEKLHTRRPHM